MHTWTGLGSHAPWGVLGTHRLSKASRTIRVAATPARLREFSPPPFLIKNGSLWGGRGGKEWGGHGRI